MKTIWIIGLSGNGTKMLISDPKGDESRCWSGRSVAVEVCNPGDLGWESKGGKSEGVARPRTSMWEAGTTKAKWRARENGLWMVLWDVGTDRVFILYGFISYSILFLHLLIFTFGCHHGMAVRRLQGRRKKSKKKKRNTQVCKVR